MSTLRPKCPPQPTECHRHLSALPGGREPSASHSKRRGTVRASPFVPRDPFVLGIACDPSSGRRYETRDAAIQAPLSSTPRLAVGERSWGEQ
eukprot:946816-Rhodomonas_salina.1